MDGRLRHGGEPRGASLFAAALTLTGLALTGCGSARGDEAGPGRTPTPVDVSEAPATGPPERVLIRTRAVLPRITIANGSTVGSTPFCPGGSAEDQHGSLEIGLVDRTITCRDGTLRMGFDPQLPKGNTQRGPWRIISGTGAYEGWRGSGVMVATYDPDDHSEHPTHLTERYTGTITRQP